jgi:diguanylate cyclase (GGDEF)-like protein
MEAVTPDAMNELRGVATGGGEAAAGAATEGDDAATRELVGWALQAPLHGGVLTSSVGRRVLATALGVPEAAVEAWSDDAIELALSRLRRLVGYCERLASEAMTDDLTGALRRGPGTAELSREIHRARRTGDGGIVVGFMDVDGLKALNDAEGHAAGDEVLRAVVRAVRERVRSYDILFRYGGDEFVCVLLGVTRAQAERTFADISERLLAMTGGRTVSIGLAELAEGDSADALIARADAALLQTRAATG